MLDLPQSKSNKLRLVIGTMMHRRYWVFQLWCNHIKRLQVSFPNIEIIPIAVGSEGKITKNLAESNGVYYHEYPNGDLKKKANARLRFAKRFDFDFIMFLGSDDVISNSLLKRYIELINQGFEIIEIMDLYYFDLQTKAFAYCDGYSSGERTGEPMAVARCISYKVADDNDWDLYGSRFSPDGAIREALNKRNYKRKQFYIKGDHLVLDIKGSGINSFNIKKSNWFEESRSYLKSKLPADEYQKLINLCT